MRPTFLAYLPAAAAAFLWLAPARGQDAADGAVTVRAISWNLESGDSDSAFIAQQAAAKGRVDLWGFCEIPDLAFAKAIDAAVEGATGATYEIVFSSEPNNADKLAILYDAGRFELVEWFELRSVQIGNAGLRPMLVAHLKGKETKQEFYFGVNHLKAMGGPSNVAKRRQQAKIINDWAETVVLPVVACGDWNMPVPTDVTAAMPPEFGELTDGGVFEFVEFDRRLKTQASVGFDTVLDFFVVANPLAGWNGDARVLSRAGNASAMPPDPFDDDGYESDHRPVEAVFAFTSATNEEAAEELRTASPCWSPNWRPCGGNCRPSRDCRAAASSTRTRLPPAEVHLSPHDAARCPTDVAPTASFRSTAGGSADS